MAPSAAEKGKPEGRTSMPCGRPAPSPASLMHIVKHPGLIDLSCFAACRFAWASSVNIASVGWLSAANDASRCRISLDRDAPFGATNVFGFLDHASTIRTSSDAVD